MVEAAAIVGLGTIRYRSAALTRLVCGDCAGNRPMLGFSWDFYKPSDAFDSEIPRICGNTICEEQ